MSKSYDERRKVICGDFIYLVDDDDMTAWIGEGHTGGGRTAVLPESVVLEGRTYMIRSVEIGAYAGEEELEELYIPDCYEFIDEGSFHGCGRLRTVHIGKGLRWYCYWSFSGSPIEKIDIDPDNPFLKVSDDGCSVLSKDGKTMFFNVIPKPALAVQDGVEVLAECAISCNDVTEEITLPPSLRKLGPNAIFKCHRLGRLTFHEGLVEVGLQSLYENESLREIDFPSTLHSVGYEAFAYDGQLEKLTLRSLQMVDIEVSDRWDVLEHCPLKTCHLLVPADLVSEYRRHPSWGRFTHIEPIEQQ